MGEMPYIEKLNSFGLTRQEAVIYMVLIENGELTGYEVAKVSLISRSNVYTALAGLVEKGAAYVIEGSSTKYIAVSLEEFCSNRIQSLEKDKESLFQCIPKPKERTEGYITIEGDIHIANKMTNMLKGTRERVYFSISAIYLEEFRDILEDCIHKKIKVVILTDAQVTFSGAKIYSTEEKGSQIRLISDSENALTGDFGKGNYDTCLYSKQSNFVNLVKEALRNEIKLIEIKKG